LYYELQASQGVVRLEVPQRVAALPGGASGEQAAAPGEQAAAPGEQAAAPGEQAAAPGEQAVDDDEDEDEGNQGMDPPNDEAPNDEVDHPGFNDCLFQISLNPARAAVAYCIKNSIFGKWRRGLSPKYPIKANSGHMHVFANNVLKEGHPLVTSSDFVGETVIAVLPERLCRRSTSKSSVQISIRNVKEYSGRLRAGAQAKLSATVAGTDQRKALFEDIMRCVGTTHMGHTTVSSPERLPMEPLVMIAPEPQPSDNDVNETGFDEDVMGAGALVAVGSNDSGADSEIEAAATDVILLLEAPPKNGPESVCYQCIIAMAYHDNGDSMDGLTVAKCLDLAFQNLPRRKATGCTRQVCRNDIRSMLSLDESKQEYAIRNNFAKQIRNRVVKK
jgi:hypothetical protein